jgi:integrase/recombinase XerC
VKSATGPCLDAGRGADAPDRARPLTEAFLDGLRRERGYSTRTIEGYRIDLEELLQLLAASLGEDASLDDPGSRGDPGPGWNLIDEHRVRRWVARRSAAGLAPRSIARRLSAWRGFFDWLLERGEVRTNAIRRVRAPRSPRLLPRALAPDQAVRLVAAPYAGHGASEPPIGLSGDSRPQAGEGLRADDDGQAGPADENGDRPEGAAFEAARDRAMFELLYASGLRLAELISLDVRHFDGAPARSISWLELEAGELVVTGKGARMRRVPVGRAAVSALADWLPVRERFLATASAADPRALFLGLRGARIGPRMVQRQIAARGQSTGIEVPVSPHMLRHSFASHLLQSSGDLRAVQELLGHASIASTQIYTALDFQRLAAVYDAAHPRARRAGPASDR